MESSTQGATEAEPATEQLREAPRPVVEGVAGAQQAIARGTLLGRYIVLDQVGRGGLGEVYAAYDPELDRKLAVKLLRPTASSHEGRQLLRARLLREAQAMAKLSHPNVVTVHDVGTLGDQIFVAMELIDGLTLRKWVKVQPRSWQDVRDVMVKAAEGLQAAHDVALIHRDLKPGNIMISSDGRVRVLDFGIARGMSTARSGGRQSGEFDSLSSGRFSEPETPTTPATALEEPITRKGLIMGTPGYMAPEQYDPAAELDARADQFAFCATLHEALYGCRPFAGRDPKLLEKATKAKEIVDPPADARVPTWLRRAVLRGLEPGRDARFGSMRELVNAMQQDRRTRKRGGIGLLIASGVLVAAGWGATQMRAAEPEDLEIVERLTNDARAAAALAFFVYPPADEPERATAYSKVLELEQLGGGAEQAADDRAIELRKEFAATLVRLGDEFWERDGGAAFAIDYYTEALVFEEANERALERAAVTRGELALLQRKADKRDFTQAELVAAESLAALSAPDDEQRATRLAAVYEGRGGASVSTGARIEALLGDKAPEVVTRGIGGKPKKKSAPAPTPAREPEPPPTAAQTPAPVPPATPTDVTKPATTEAKSASKRDPALARKEAKAGRAAFNAGKLGEAEAAYHRALDADPGSTAALVGLTELHFERGEYLKATKFGAQAAKLSPKDAGLRILLGDAYFKLLRYADARTHYEKAKSLGHAKAGDRLARLDKMMGG